MQITTVQLATEALRLCGQSGRPGRGISSEQQTEVIQFLNQMLDGMNTLRGSIFTVNIARYALVPSQTTYFIGPTGDFVAPRPIRIVNANLVLTNASPEAHLPMRILNDDEWADIRVTEIPTTVPRLLYNDGNSPDSQLYLWGFPTQANDLELFTWQGLNNALGPTDTLAYPDGYARAILYKLAVEIAPLYWKKTDKLLALVQQQAISAYAAISNLNQDVPYMQSDGYLGLSNVRDWDYYDYLTGGM